MGWTGTLNHVGSVKDFLINEFTSENDTHKWELTDVSMKGSTAYGIYKVMDKPTGIITGECIVIRTRKEDGWIYYKEMGESTMPYYYDAPKKLLDKADLLYPPCNDHAVEWRAKCRAQLNKAKVRVAFGSRIKFDHELSFKFASGEFKSDTFTLVEYGNRRGIFQTAENQLVRIPNWKKRNFTVLEVSA